MKRQVGELIFQGNCIDKKNKEAYYIPVGGILSLISYMYRPKDQKERILHRLKITKGHLEKVITMVEEDTYCIDVLHQMDAIEKGINGTGIVLLEHHLKTCVADAIAQGKKDEAIAEIMEVFKKK